MYRLTFFLFCLWQIQAGQTLSIGSDRDETRIQTVQKEVDPIAAELDSILSFTIELSEGAHSSEYMRSERDLANRLLSRLLDVAYETFREMGGSEEELREVQRKRSHIAACYFQAITCY